MKEMISVGLSEIKMSLPQQILKTSGLGSCVGVVLYSSNQKVAGMAHVMLPEAALARSESFPPGKFADTAVPELIRQLTSRGLTMSDLRAKIAGGAEMFKSGVATLTGRIGPRNVTAVKKELNRFRIPIISEDTGGHHGRTIEFFADSSILYIRTIKKGEKRI